MKAFLSVDLEGLPYVVALGHLGLKGSLYEEARKVATKVALSAANELHENGFDEILVADSHGPMVNLLVDDLPEYVEIVRGFPRPLSMVAGIEGSDAALFLGYHAKFGTAKSTFDHTYSGSSVSQVEVNGIAASEFLLNSYVAGEMGVPVILVAGDAQLLEDDVRVHAPWAERVALKRSLSRVSARSYSMARVERELAEGTKRAVSNFKQGRAKTLMAEKPVGMAVTFSASHFADAAELLPFVNRIDGLKVGFAADSMVQAYKVFEFLLLATIGMSNVLQNSS
ncbi:MAG: M55 family metallopeptidase [Candidatus Brockarchaeota archaeon]|nr:M55 family metallopeptidase [Candidatus Brockarchaeota archaeon]